MENSPPSARTRTLDALNRVDAALAALELDRRPFEHYDDLHTLMTAVLDLGLATTVEGNPDADIRIEERIQSQGSRLHSIMHLLTYYVSRWEERFWGEWTGDWFELCRGRSGLEYLLEIYRDTDFSRGDFRLDLEELEDLDCEIRRLREYEGGMADENIPLGIPQSHWWWR